MKTIDKTRSMVFYLEAFRRCAWYTSDDNNDYTGLPVSWVKQTRGFMFTIQCSKWQIWVLLESTGAGEGLHLCPQRLQLQITGAHSSDPGRQGGKKNTTTAKRWIMPEAKSFHYRYAEVLLLKWQGLHPHPLKKQRRDAAKYGRLGGWAHKLRTLDDPSSLGLRCLICRTRGLN